MPRLWKQLAELLTIFRTILTFCIDVQFYFKSKISEQMQKKFTTFFFSKIIKVTTTQSTLEFYYSKELKNPRRNSPGSLPDRDRQERLAEFSLSLFSHIRSSLPRGKTF